MSSFGSRGGKSWLWCSVMNCLICDTLRGCNEGYLVQWNKIPDWVYHRGPDHESQAYIHIIWVSDSRCHVSPCLPHPRHQIPVICNIAHTDGWMYVMGDGLYPSLASSPERENLLGNIIWNTSNMFVIYESKSLNLTIIHLYLDWIISSYLDQIDHANIIF